MVAAVAPHVSGGVSKTVLLDGDGTPSRDVREVFLGAWRAGIKGITVYRRGSLPDEPIVANV
jgi:ribonucleoside-diphosphate reductase alpha chain